MNDIATITAEQGHHRLNYLFDEASRYHSSNPELSRYFYSCLKDLSFKLLVPIHESISIRFCSRCCWPVNEDILESSCILPRYKASKGWKSIHPKSTSFLRRVCSSCHWINEIKGENIQTKKERHRSTRLKILRGPIKKIENVKEINQLNNNNKKPFNPIVMTPVGVKKHKKKLATFSKLQELKRGQKKDEIKAKKNEDKIKKNAKKKKKDGAEKKKNSLESFLASLT